MANNLDSKRRLTAERWGGRLPLLGRCRSRRSGSCQAGGSDTCLLRADAVAWIAGKLSNYGVLFQEQTHGEEFSTNDSGVVLRCRREGVDFTVEGRFVIDGSGASSVLGMRLGMAPCGPRAEDAMFR